MMTREGEANHRTMGLNPYWTLGMMMGFELLQQMQRRDKILDHVDVLVQIHAEEDTRLTHVSEAITWELRAVGKDVEFHPCYGDTSGTKQQVEEKQL